LPGMEVRTTLGAGGQMDVFRDGVMVFSYQESGTMPSLAKLVERVQAG
jgi:predicted Rdx family selenoprotein